DPRLPAGDAVVAAVGEEEPEPAHRAQPDVVDLVDPGVAELRGRHLRQVEVALADAGVVALEDLVDLLADLVAATARRRAERGLDRAVGTELAQRGDAL